MNDAGRSVSTRPRRRRWLFVCIIGGVLAMFAFFLFQPSEPPNPPLPNPNGYDAFQAAFKVMVTTEGSKQGTQTVEQLRVAVQQNSNALRLVRSGLTKECRVRLESRRLFDPVTKEPVPALDVSVIKATAALFVDEAKIFVASKETNEALRVLNEGMLFAHKAANGGLMLDHLVSVASQSLLTREARPLLNSADAGTTAQLAKTLRYIEEGRESAEVVIARDYDWGMSQQTSFTRLVSGSAMRRLLKPAGDKFRVRFGSSIVEVRQLRADCALRLFWLANGRYPETLTELVPQYLDAVPTDSNNKPLTYRASTNSYTIHSAGGS